MRTKPVLTVVIPCYNEQEVLPITYSELKSTIQNLVDKEIIKDYYLLFVNDGSKDDTKDILYNLAKKDKRVQVISFSRNFGHQAALLAGMEKATGDIIITIDADLQDPPEIIEKMIREYNQGAEIVFAVRKSRESDNYFKRSTAHLFYKVMRIMGVNLIFDHADYRLLSRKAVEALKNFQEINLFLRGLIPCLGFKQSKVYYDRTQRVAGETKYPIHKMIAFAWDGITSFSGWPLRIASITGIIISLTAFLLLIWAFYIKLVHKAIPGWASMVIPIYFLGGVNLISIGLLGEYVHKIYMETKKRPRYILMETINLER